MVSVRSKNAYTGDTHFFDNRSTDVGKLLIIQDVVYSLT